MSEEKAAVDDIVSQALWRGIRARIVVEEDAAAAEMLARAAVGLADETDFLELQGDVLLDLADVLERRGDTEESAAAAGRAAERYRGQGRRRLRTARRARATTRTP